MIKDYVAVLGSFRLNSAGLYNQALTRIKHDEKVLVDTGISYNVDHELAHLDKDRFDILTKIHVEHFLNYDFYVTNHLKWLGRDQVEYGLVHFPEDGWINLIQRMKQDPRFKHVGVSNFTIENLKEYYEAFNEWPCVNEIEYSIMFHDDELVNFCHENGIEVLGYGIFNGIHNSKLTRREFLPETCIRYCLKNDVIPILRSDNWMNLFSDLMILNIGMEDGEGFPETDAHGYIMNGDATGVNKALNKFRYDKPKCSIVYYSDKLALQSLDSKSTLMLGSSGFLGNLKVRPSSLKLSKEVAPYYSPLDKKHMMVTDYLIDFKYNKCEPTDMIICSDDMLVNTTKKVLMSVILMNKEFELIKSGVEGTQVYNCILNYK